METFSRHRPLSLLAIVVLVQVLLLAYQIKRDRDVRLIRFWAVELMTPVQSGGTWTFSKFGGVWTGYIGLRNARRENARLQEEVDQLQLQNRELQSDAAEGQRLRLMLNFRQGHSEAPMLAAQVIGASADANSHILYVNRGEHDHVRRNMAVITPGGIVGKVVEVYPGSAQVLLINDKDSGVGALFSDSRTHGVVKGSGDPDPRMDYVVNDEKVHPGEVLLTSGEDRIFPKGLLIGSVSGATPGNPFQIIRVKPAARLDQLEDVLILLSEQELTPKTSDVGFAVVPAAAPPNPQTDVPVSASGSSSPANAAASAAPPQKPTAAPSQASPAKPVSTH